MVRLTSISAALSCLALTSAVAVKNFKFSGNATTPVQCPQSDRTIYTAPNGNKFGVLCDTDTNDTSYQWGPFFGLTFRECLCRCDDRPGCTLATYTGACYLKRSAFGAGSTDGATAVDWTAVKLGTDYLG